MQSFKAGIANDIRNELVRTAPVDEGRLKNSIKVEFINNELTVYMVDYALFVEFGTKPHIIRPVNKKSLKFKGRDGGDVFAKQVNHPGTQPQPFIRNMFYHKLPRIVQRNALLHLSGADVEVSYT